MSLKVGRMKHEHRQVLSQGEINLNNALHPLETTCEQKGSACKDTVIYQSCAALLIALLALKYHLIKFNHL